MFKHLYMLLENSAKHFTNLMNLKEIYIFLYQQLESGKRIFYLTWAQMCSGWAIVIGLCPSSVVVRRPSCVVRKLFYLNIFSSEPLIGFWPNFTGMIPGWTPTKVVQIVPVGCINRSQGQKIGFQNAIFKNLLVWNYKAHAFIFGM